MEHRDKTLSEVLAELGYEHGPTEKAQRGLSYAHDVTKEGEVVFTGPAGDVWRWLRETALEAHALEAGRGSC